jgi:hypothetical protein
MLTMFSTPLAFVSAGEPASVAVSAIPVANTVVVGQPCSLASSSSPWISGQLNRTVAEKLEVGYELAITQLGRHRECRDLFTNLGADGLEMLSTTLYYPAGVQQERDVCRRGEAYTLVGGAPTWLCRRFAWVSDRWAALLVLHEALHHAGLGEWPHDRKAPSSQEINEMVSEACGL